MPICSPQRLTLSFCSLFLIELAVAAQEPVHRPDPLTVEERGRMRRIDPRQLTPNVRRTPAQDDRGHWRVPGQQLDGARLFDPRAVWDHHADPTFIVATDFGERLHLAVSEPDDRAGATTA